MTKVMNSKEIEKGILPELYHTQSDMSFVGDFLVTPYEKVLKILNKVSACLKVHEEFNLYDEIKYVINKVESRQLYSYYENELLTNNIQENNIEFKSFIDSINEYSERSYLRKDTNTTNNRKTLTKTNFRSNNKTRFNTVQVGNKDQLKAKLDEHIKLSTNFLVREDSKEVYSPVNLPSNRLNFSNNNVTNNKNSDNNTNRNNYDSEFSNVTEQLKSSKYTYSPNENEDQTIINTIDIKIIENLNQSICSTAFNIFDFFSTYKNSSFPILSRFILKSLNLYPLINLFNLDSYISAIQDGYSKTPNYHNEIHGVDVAHTLYSFMVFSKDFENTFKFSKLDILSLILSGFCHDLGHPGYNNSFHINSLSTFAVKYNDKSVLENYHASEATRLLLLPENNILDCLEKADFNVFRKHFIECILATDMTLHVRTNSLIKTKLSSLNIIRGKNIETLIKEENIGETQQELMNFLLHTADIAHNSKPFEISFNWTVRLCDEFWNQGDTEKSMNLPISFLCDRDTADVPKSQIGFIKGIICPSFEILLDILPDLTHTMDCINDNLNNWSKMTMEDFTKKRSISIIEKEKEKTMKNKKVEFAKVSSTQVKPKLQFEVHFTATDLDETIIN
jgi:hypothetical protein